jgi:ABC-type cobalamin transport system permease subunit
MNRTITETLHDLGHAPLTDAGTSGNSDANAGISQLVLHFPNWKLKAILIESLIIVAGFICVLIYNWLFNAAISPLLGVVIGLVNGSLVAWCITHAEKITQRQR